MESIINIGITVLLLFLGFYFGTKAEKRHIKSLQEREKKFLNLPISTKKKFDNNYQEVKIFTGSVVVGQDYFKSFVSVIKSFFGGELNAYESLLNRARREALLRMKEEAINWGAQEICNLKIETSSIQSGKAKNSGSCEVLAYATAGKS